ncbi:MAG: queuosine precursor transporter [Phycisphaerales bacterium]|nr:queuosine precursor transporter [Phycisphaerales bacterium]
MASVTDQQTRSYRFYEACVVGFVTVLLCSNLIGPGKVSVLFGFSFGVGNVFFPISYIFGDVLTEVYGYAAARRAIWLGFAAMLFASAMSLVVVHMPADPAEAHNQAMQPALEVIFGNTWRVIVASMLAFWAGDFANSYVLSRMKVLTRGRHLWTRTIGSTVVGQAIDSVVLYPFAFLGVWSYATIGKVVLVNWVFKVAIEVVMTPVTYRVVGALKRAEQVDVFDDGVDYNPFHLRR